MFPLSSLWAAARLSLGLGAALLAVAAPAAPVSIWSTNDVPAVESVEDSAQVELGVKFQSAQAGYITGIRFYKGTNNTGLHIGRLWTSDGELLASAIFANESSSGWQQQSFDAPVAIASNTTYVASYRAPNGGYAANTGYFLGNGATNFPLRALPDGESGGNGVYRYGEGAFPNLSFNGANYWVDVVFDTVPPVDTNPPTVLSYTPASGATNVALAGVVTINFSEALLPASVSSNNFFIKDAANVTQPAVVTLSGNQLAVTITPNVALAPLTNFTVTIKGGATGVADLATNRLAADVTWSFTTGPGDTTPPEVIAYSPGPGITGVSLGARVQVTFSEAMLVSSVTNGGITLSNSPGGGNVPVTVTYDAVSRQATVTPNALLNPGTNYLVTVRAGTNGVRDLSSNPLATNLTWTFSTMPAHPYGEGPGGPLLVITSSTNRITAYLAEILRAEGFNNFSLRDIGDVSTSVLTNYDVAILGYMSLSSAQANTLSNWVAGGGRLIAMRPDARLHGLMGLINTGATLTNAYLLVSNASKPGVGIVGETIQFRGVASRFALSNATAVATLYSGVATATTNPAVTWRAFGTNGGRAAAFSYDLAQSVALMRQGNPAWANQERDGYAPLRSSDLFFGNASFDPQPDWVNLDKVAIPQADEQQRLLANLILELLLPKRPLPRLWYFPDGHKAVVVMTGDDHANNGTQPRFEQYLTYSPSNNAAAVTNWAAVRSSSYLYFNTPLSNALAASYHSNGFELGLHLNTGCANYDRGDLESFFQVQLAAFQANFPSLPPPTTLRTHCIAWSGYTLMPEVARHFGIRFDVNYYFWPPVWVANRPGIFTGSAMPMRFATVEGTIIDCFQAATQLTDESGQSYPATINTLLDRALGSEGYYGAYVANMHTDFNPLPESDAIVNSALTRGVPVISARQMLTWLDARQAVSLTNQVWTNKTLFFNASVPAAARGLRTLVPIPNGHTLVNVLSNGTAIAAGTQTLKGYEYVVIPTGTAGYHVNFATDTTPPTIVSVSPTNTATGVSPATGVSVTFSEAMLASSLTTNNIRLLTAASNLVPASLSYNPATYTVSLQPSNALSLGATYLIDVRGGSNGVADLSTNWLAASAQTSFTVRAVEFLSLWNDAVTPGTPSADDPNAYELGTKFESAVAGYVVGVRFYKGTNNTGTHTGNLWTIGGSNLATVTFTGETASGWQEQLFPAPVAIASNTTYVISYFAPNGGYAVDAPYFTTSYTNAPLRAPASGLVGGNGVYRELTPGFPTNSFNSANYYVSPIFAETLGPDTNPPVVVSITPTNGATNVPVTSTVSAVFNEALLAATVTTNTFVLLTPASNMVPASVTWNAGTQTATLTPSNALALGVTYTARLLGGTNGLADLATNRLASNYVWSFTTQLPDTNPPVVLAVTPTNGATEVPLNSVLTVAFNEAMLSNTITTNTLRLFDAASNLVSAVVSYNPSNFTATLAPTALLAVNETYTARVTGGASGVRDLASNALASDFVWSFTSSSQLASNLWGNAFTPAIASADDPNAYELGVKFQSQLAGFIRGIRFYKGTNNTGTHIGNLWTAGGSNLASVTFTGETASGWQEQLFASPVPIAANTTYIASYHCPNGGYAVDTGYFIAAGWTNYPLRALTNNEAGPNGVFALSGTSTFPTNGIGGNYWVDVVFAETVGPDTNAPLVVSVSPTNGATNVLVTTTVSAVFNEALLAGTVNTNTFVLLTAASNVVPASVAWNAGTLTATLTPSNNLALGQTYTARLLGGTNGIADLATNRLASNFVWSFTTQPPDTNPPVVVSVTPTNGATGVAPGTTVVVVFNEAMDAATINTNTVRLLDAASNTVPATLTYDGGTFTVTLTPTAALGLGQTFTVRVDGVTDVQANPLDAPFTAVFTVVDQITIWPPSATPTYITYDPGDTNSYEFGVKFSSSQAGVITGIRFYKGPENTGTHVGNLWTLGGSNLATAVFTNETASGWQQVDFASPVPIASNTIYVASYFAPQGGYSVDLSGDPGSLQNGVTNAPLRAVPNTESANGVLVGSPVSAFPTNSANGINWWVDVVFAAGANTPPVVANPIADQSFGYGTNFSFTFPTNTFTDAESPVLSYTATGLPPGVSFNGTTRTFSGTPTAIGAYPISVVATDTGAPPLSATNTFTMTIVAAPLTVTALNTNKIYGTVVQPTLFSAAGLRLSDTVTNVTLASAGTNVAATIGTYPITATNALGTGLTNYAITYAAGTLTVNAASLTITAVDTNKVYGVELQPVLYTVAGLLNADSVTNVTLTSAGSGTNAPVGSYAIVPSLAEGAGLTNYVIGYSNGLLTVGAASLTITALDTIKLAGVTLTFAGTEFVVAGLLNDDAVTSAELASDGAPASASAGTYPITITNAVGTGLSNYVITFVAGTLTVTNAGLEFRITSILLTNGVATVTWNSVSNLSYVLEYNDDLAGTNWVEVPPAIVATGTNATHTNLLGGALQRFYRVRLGTLTLPPVPAPFITSLVLSNNVALVSWTSVSNATYRLQYKTDLLAPVWVDVIPDVTATGTNTTHTNFIGTDPQRFYRVLVP
ncbi:MAG: DUF4082 domain-containing protein [Limisphaerales bacterium]